MRLFDTPPTADTSPAKYGESDYEYLCQTGKPPFLRARKLMEDWLAEFPEQGRKELTARLRSRDNHHFGAAFFELYLHALLQRLGYSVQVHPCAGTRNKRADFLVERDGQKLLIEAASVAELSDAARAEDSRLNSVYDALNRIHCPDYFLTIEHLGKLSSPVPGQKLRHRLRQFLESLDYEAVRGLAKNQPANLPEFIFSHGDFRLKIGVIPVSPERRGHPGHRPVGVHGPGKGAWVDDHTPIRNKVCQKAGNYGALHCPLMIAINDASGHADDIDIMDALFGTERWMSSSRPGRPNQPAFRRAPDGALVGPEGPQNRNVSALLIISALRPWTVATAEPLIYHNPWARHPAEAVPDSIVQFRLEGQQMVPRGGCPVRETLGLPTGWPHFERQRELPKPGSTMEA